MGPSKRQVREGSKKSAIREPELYRFFARSARSHKLWNGKLSAPENARILRAKSASEATPRQVPPAARSLALQGTAKA
jgi:hypothetical protein